MRIAVVVVPFLFSSLLAAQSTAGSPSSMESSRTTMMAQVTSCPVRMSVKRAGQAVIMDAGRSGQPSSLFDVAAPNANQGLGLTVTGGHGAIKSLDLMVYGMDAGSHIIPAASNAQEMQESVHLSVSNGQAINNTPLHTTHIAIFSRVRLTGIEYADGTVWKATSANECVASPSLYVLVDAAAR